uniref:alcohol dehydrogenase n=1 Tax=Solanum lycopersicum TaxID=4081 RepID=A0A3Q7GFA7_SOLLC
MLFKPTKDSSVVVAVLIVMYPIRKLCSRHTFELFNESTIKVTFFGNWTPRSDIPSFVEKYMNKELELEKFITHTLPIL